MHVCETGFFKLREAKLVTQGYTVVNAGIGISIQA